MKILMVSDMIYPDDMGGSGRYLRETCEGLSSRGHDIHVLTHRWKQDQPKAERWGNIQIYRYSVDDQTTLGLFRSTIRNANAIVQNLIRDHAYDIVNIHSPLVGLGIKGLKFQDHVKMIYTFHSPWHKEYEIKTEASPSPLRGLQIYMRKRIERSVLTKCSTAIVLSQYMENQLREAHPQCAIRIAQCPGGADIYNFRPSNDRVHLRNQLNLPLDKTILLTVRGLTPRTGVKNLIMAMESVVQENPRVHLIIGGEGVQKKELQQLADNRGLKNYITFAGLMTNDQLVVYYQAADYFILPTKHLEGFGLVTAEALSCGLPVLGTPVGGTIELLNRLDPDLLFKDAGPEAMAELILKYAKVKKPDWDTLSCRCRLFIEEHYSWERSVEKTERVFLS